MSNYSGAWFLTRHAVERDVPLKVRIGRRAVSFLAVIFLLLAIAFPIGASEISLYRPASVWQTSGAGSGYRSQSSLYTQPPTRWASSYQVQSGSTSSQRSTPQLGSAFQGEFYQVPQTGSQSATHYAPPGRRIPATPVSFAPVADDIRQMTEPGRGIGAGFGQRNVGQSDPRYIPPIGPIGPPNSPSQQFVATEDAMIRAMTEEEKPPAGLRRNGFFQSVHLRTGWLAPMGDLYLSMVDVETWLKFVIPGPVDRSMIMFTPGFGIHTFDGADALDLPNRVFDVYINTSLRGYIGTRWSYNMTVMFGWYGDTIGSSVGGSPFRIRGYGLGVYKWSDTVELSLGTAYIDYGPYRILPLVGLTWIPSDDWKLDFSFPYPKLARRIYYEPFRPKQLEYWCYLAGEFGGGTWQVRMDGQVNGQGEPISDMLTYTDWRVMIGLERRVARGFETRFEVGYSFARELEYDDRGDTIDLPSTLMLRATAIY